MKFKNFFIMLVLCIITNLLYSQHNLDYKSKWQTKPAFGFNIPITKILKGSITDYLLGYDDQSEYWQLVSASYFFHKRWGVDFMFQGATSNRLSSRASKFFQMISSEYQNDYFVTPQSGPSYDGFCIIGGNTERGYLGIIYRFESNHFLIYPKLSIGVTSFDTDVGSAILKEKNSNRVLKVSYESDKVNNDYLTIATSATIGYKISKRFFFNVDLMTSHFKINKIYVKSIKDLNSGIINIEEISYQKNVFNLSVGAGIIIVIK